MTPSQAPFLTRQEIVGTLMEVRKAAVIRAAVELGVFEHLAGEPVDAETVARAVGADPRGTRILLCALAAIGVLRGEGGRFTLPPDLVKALVPAEGNYEYIGAAVRLTSTDAEWQGLARLAEAVRHGGSVLDIGLENPEAAYLEEWAELAAGGSDTIALAGRTAEVLRPWTRTRPRLSVLDLACGPGWYGYALAAANPGSRVHGVDFPHILPYAERNARERGIADRVTFTAGDMFEVELGGPYDVALVAGVLHHFSAGRVRALLGRLAEAVVPGGRLVISAPVISDSDPARDPRAHLFSALMLVLTREGQVYSLDEYTEMLADHGFGAPELHSKPGSSIRILVAERLG
ncbi:methyltransferase [Streptomyces sp. NPDC001381]|uniref:methyltransferase n=1 Tax=Streptomyces sp. NPDC001381 TaxID=3364567 RepID=UPI0036A7BB60